MNYHQFLTYLLALLFGAALVLSAKAAEAQFAGCRCGVINSMHDETRTHVSQETTEAANNVINALRSQTQQNSRYLDRQVEAAERIANASSQNDAQLVRSQIRALAESGQFDPNPDYCLILDTAIQPQLPRDALYPTTTSSVQNAKAWLRGDAGPVVANGLKMASFLTLEREEIKNAMGANDATTEWGVVLDQSTINLADESAQRALSRLIANTVDPFPPKPMDSKDLQTPEGLSESVIRRATDARNQAAISAIDLVLDLVSPSIDAAPYRTIAERTRYEKDIPDVISELQALEIRMAAYYEPSVESLEIRHTKSERALLQDLIDLMALNSRILHLQLQQDSRSSIIQAALLGLLTDGTKSTLNIQW